MTNPAAKRLRRLKRHGGSDSVFVTHGNGEAVSLNDVRADYENVVDAYLSEHLPDDGEAIDEEFVKSVLPCTFEAEGVREYAIGKSTSGSTAIVRFIDPMPHCAGSIAVYIGNYYLPHIRTRGQLRLLLRALGVEGEGK